ncbi:hypothetical protein [Microbacterium sp. NPDC089695]|uniref:DUF7507 domain-containing protein n=1 Tax=Microbacterium sp. NPDC089695 TaxID=3364198 RepID=UPI00381FDE44
MPRVIAGMIAVILIAALVVVAVPLAASAAPRPLTPTYSATVVGGFVQAGNALAQCNPACGHTIASGQSNGNSPMQPLDADAVASTNNSSASVVAIPQGARVVRAQLSWGGYADSGSGTPVNGWNPGSENLPVVVSVGTAAPTYTSVSPDPGRASLSDNGAGQPNRWLASSADITSQFAGKTGSQVVWVGNAPIWRVNPNRNSTLGWGLTVVYEWPDGVDIPAGHVAHAVTVLEGQYVQVANAAPTTQTVSTPPILDGNDVVAGIIATEGDVDVQNDTFSINGGAAANRVPEPNTGSTTNFFISAADGTNLPGADPSWPSNQNIDVKSFTVPPGLVANGSQQLTLRTQTTGDGFGIMQMVLSVPVAAMSLTKTPDPATYDHVGQQITYTFDVQNTGTAQIDGVAIDDPFPGLGPITCDAGTPGAFSLAPGATTQCRAPYTITAADLGTSRVLSNTAEAVGQSPDGAEVRSTAATTEIRCDPCSPSLSIEKSAPDTAVTLGDTVTYSYTVTNTGDVPLADVHIADPQPGLPPLTCNPPLGSTLAPGEIMTCTATVEVTAEDAARGSMPNTAAVATGTPTSGAPPVSASDDEAVPTVAAAPSLTIDKSTPTASYKAVGDVVEYSFVVVNTGNVRIDDLAIDDDQLDTAATCPVTTLAPGATTTCSGSHTITQQDLDAADDLVNVATATGVLPGGAPIASPQDSVTVIESLPELVLEKSAGVPVDVNGSGLTDAGDTIAFSFTVTNAGNVPVTGVVVDDPLAGAVTCDVTALAVGAVASCTADAVYVVTAADEAAGAVSNTATASGVDPDGDAVVSNEDSTSTPVTAPAPRITLDKRAGEVVDADGDGQVTPGDTIAFSFTVTNAGTVPLADVVLTDPLLGGGVDCPQTALPVGGSMDCGPILYLLSQADVDAGAVRNTAAVTATPPSGPAVGDDDSTETTTAGAARLSIEKTFTLADRDGDASADAGERIVFGFLVTNTGTITLRDVGVDDPMLVSAGVDVTCQVTLLAPGESTQCEGDYTATAADTRAGDIRNVATAFGTVIGCVGACEPISSAPDDVLVPTNPPVGLAVTGGVVAWAIVGIAVGLLALGILLLVVRRRRSE